MSAFTFAVMPEACRDGVARLLVDHFDELRLEIERRDEQLAQCPRISRHQ